MTKTEEIMGLAQAAALADLSWDISSGRHPTDAMTHNVPQTYAALKSAIEKLTDRCDDLEWQLKTAIEGQRCECSTDDMCRFAKERDELRKSHER